MNFRFHSSSEEDTLRFGRALGAAVAPGVTVLLSGELGAGKTVLVRGVGEALGVKGVRSPSFTLVNEYQARDFILIHADLYRLTPEAADELGLEDYADGPDKCAVFVEWPDRWRPPERDVLKIGIFAAAPDGEADRITTDRVIEASSSGEKADAVLSNLRETLEEAFKEAMINRDSQGPAALKLGRSPGYENV